MDGLFFLGAIAGIVLLMLWVAQNDKVGIDEPTTGLFAMRETPPDAGKAAGKAGAKLGGKARPADGASDATPAGRGRTHAGASRRGSMPR